MTEYATSRRRKSFDLERAYHERVVAEGAQSGEHAGSDMPATHVRRYASDAVCHDAGAFHKGGIKCWTQAPFRGKGPDPRGFLHHDTDGVPIVTSRKEIAEVVARTRDTNNPLIWDGD